MATLSALDLTILGMGFVFVFLIALVFFMRLMSWSIRILTPKKPPETTTVPPADEVDEEARFVIEQAIKMHRGS